jgi:asparagine synthetase A
MKTLLLFVFFFVAVSSMAQDDSTLSKLKSVYVNQVAWEEAGDLNYDQNTKEITVKNFKIPVTGNTRLNFDKKGNKVIFALQNNTSITDVTDPEFRRAYFEIPFKTKDGAVSFITYFNKLKEEQ